MTLFVTLQCHLLTCPESPFGLRRYQVHLNSLHDAPPSERIVFSDHRGVLCRGLSEIGSGDFRQQFRSLIPAVSPACTAHDSPASPLPFALPAVPHSHSRSQFPCAFHAPCPAQLTTASRSSAGQSSAHPRVPPWDPPNQVGGFPLREPQLALPRPAFR